MCASWQLITSIFVSFQAIAPTEHKCLILLQSVGVDRKQANNDDDVYDARFSPVEASMHFMKFA